MNRVVLIVVFFLFSFSVASQEAPNGGSDGANLDTSSSDDPALKQLELEQKRTETKKAIAVAQQGIAEAKKAEREAKLPDSDKPGLDGTIKVNDGAGYYSTILAYETLPMTATTIVSEIPSTSKNILITTNSEVSKAAGLRNVTQIKLEEFQKIFDELKKMYKKNADGTISYPGDEVLAALAALPNYLGAAAEIASFFQVNRETFGVSVSLDENALIAEVARALKKKNDNIKVHLPSFNLNARGPLATLMERLLDDRRDLAERKRKLKEQLDPDLKELAKLRNQKGKHEAERKKLEEQDADANATRIAELTKLLRSLNGKIPAKENSENIWNDAKARLDPAISAFVALAEALLTPPDKGSKAPMEMIAAIDVIDSFDDATILYLDIVSQGGELHTTTRVFSQGRIHYLGGSVVVYFLLNADGEFINASSIVKTKARSFRGGAGIEEMFEE